MTQQFSNEDSRALRAVSNLNSEARTEQEGK